MSRILPNLCFASLLLLLSGCGNPDDSTAVKTGVEADVTAEVEAFYAANPDFFGFRTLADVPADLSWEAGEGLAEIGSPEARKGGTQYGALQDFPRTLRTVGPDSNGGFRTFLLDDVGMSLAHLHPGTRELYPGLAEAWALDPENRTVYIRLDPKA
ncbi:MAG TPA: ABC transporter substrate-binding protein, partial [Kineobactrum sp.]